MFFLCSKVLYLNPKLLEEVFQEQLKQPEDAKRLRDQMEVVTRRYGNKWVERPITRALTVGDKISDEWVLALLFRAAMFGNTPSDGVVGIESQWGGLSERYTTTICHVLHEGETTNPYVQNRVITLLLGPQPRLSRTFWCHIPA